MVSMKKSYLLLTVLLLILFIELIFLSINGHRDTPVSIKVIVPEFARDMLSAKDTDANNEKAHEEESNNSHWPPSLVYPSEKELLWIDAQLPEMLLIRRVAYYDDRFDQPQIVFIAMRNDKDAKKEKYYAKLFYETRVVCTPLEFWIKSGRVDLKHNLPEIYVNYLLRTVEGVSSTEEILQISITTDKECTNNLSDPIAVKYGKVDKRVKFAVCLHKGLFRITDPQMLVDWIEIHKQLGVEFFTVYMEDPNDEIKKAVQPYINELTLELLDWKLNKVTRDYGQSGVMNECLYRYLYKAEYLATYDLDEVVIGQNNYTWNDLMDYLSITVKDFNKYASIKLLGLSWQDTTDTTKIIGYNETFCNVNRRPIYFNRTDRSLAAQDHPKLMIRPKFVTSVQVHRLVGWIEGSMEEYIVPENVATCHHYRLQYRPSPVKYSNVTARYLKPILKSLCSRSH